MKKFIIPLVTAVAVVSIILAGCVPEAAPPVEPPVEPPVAPPVAPPVEPPVEPPVTPAVGCTPPARTPPEGTTSFVGTCPDPDAYIFEPVHATTVKGIPTAESEGIWDGLAVKPDGTPYNILWQVSTLAGPWVVSSHGVAKSYFERAGATVTMFDSKWDAERERSNLSDALVKGGWDAFMMLPMDTVSLIPLIENIADEGYPFFTWGNKVPGPAVVSTSAHDYISIGEDAGKVFAEYAEERGEMLTVYELWGRMSQSDAIQRSRGLHNMLDPHPLVTVVESPPCNWNAVLAQDAIVEIFSAHPEWHAIFDMGNMISGAVEGLRMIDRLYPVGDPEHVFLVSIDGSPVAMESLENNFADAVIAHSPWEETDACIKSMYHYLILGQPVARVYDCRSYALTVADADNPLQWGNALRMEIPFDDCPILHQPDVIETPTLAMRMELCGY